MQNNCVHNSCLQYLLDMGALIGKRSVIPLPQKVHLLYLLTI